jgi:hypothetical protein
MYIWNCERDSWQFVQVATRRKGSQFTIQLLNISCRQPWWRGIPNAVCGEEAEAAPSVGLQNGVND